MFSINRFVSLDITQGLKELQKYLFIFLPLAIFSGPFLADLFITIIALVFLFFLLKDKLYKNKNFIIFFFLFFWVFIIISSINSLYIKSTLPDLLIYIRFLFFVLGGIYVINNFKNSVKLFSMCLFLTYILAITDGYIQYFFDQGLTGIGYNKARLSMPLSGELVMGSFLSRLFPIMLMFNLYFFRNNKYMIYVISIIFILVDVLIYLSGERAAFFYLILSTILILLMLDRYKILRFVTFLISILVITFISISDDKVKNRMFDQTIKDFRSDQTSEAKINQSKDNDTFESNNEYKISFFNKYYAFTQAHTALYSSAINIFLDNNLIIGTGPKTFRYYCKMDNYISKYGYDSCSTHPHNTYIQLLTETGIIGFLCIFLLFLFISYKIIEQIYLNVFKRQLNLNYINIGCYVAIFISLWPFVPTGNFFNNWLSVIYFMPFIFIFSNKSNYE